MHGDRNHSGWSELKGKAKRQWDKIKDKPLNSLDASRNNSDEDVYDTQKIKNDRADKQLRDIENILQGMSSYQNKKR